MTEPPSGRPDRTTYAGAHEGRRVPAAAARWYRLETVLPLVWWMPPSEGRPPDAARCLERIALGAYVALMCKPREEEILAALIAGATLEQVAAASGPLSEAPQEIRARCVRHITEYRRYNRDLITADAARATLALLGEELPADLEDVPDDHA